MVDLGHEAGMRAEERSDPARIAALLHRIDSLPSGATGALSFDGGVVLVQERRVCWAASSSMQTRLTDRLRHVAQLPPVVLENLFRECRNQGIPLGQALVTRGLLDPAALRLTLLDHTSEALAQLACTTVQDARWTPAGDRKYDAEFTFSTTELLAHASDTYWGPLAQVVRDELDRVLENGGTGCAFVPSSDGVPVPIGVHDAEALGAEGIVELGRWAAGVLHSAAGIVPSSRFVGALKEEGIAAAAWTHDGICYAALLANSIDFANVVIRLKRP
jgi:hypothetical protein